MNFDVFIGYKPLAGEIDYATTPILEKNNNRIIFLPQTRDSDPFAWADDCKNNHAGKKVCILLPGKNFDRLGTRHGHGGGWYDRFLSRVPADWIRIGVADKSQIINSTLIRQSWDEPVDWILIKDNLSWRIYETKARKKTGKKDR